MVAPAFKQEEVSQRRDRHLKHAIVEPGDQEVNSEHVEAVAVLQYVRPCTAIISVRSVLLTARLFW